MRVVVGAASDIGQVREGNEDSFLVEQPLFAVADGMGGHRGGEVASNLALDTIHRMFSDREGSLVDQVVEANRKVFERSKADRAVAGMGTTLTAALVDGSRVRLAHVGDSRAYLYRGGDLSLLTEDHTLVHRMVMAGEITEAEAEVHPHRSILTRALGVDGGVDVDQLEVEVRSGDRILLCTDGLTGMVSQEHIRSILDSATDPQETADRLVTAANHAGGIDNITAVVLDFRDDGGDGETRETAVSHEGTREQAVPEGAGRRRNSDITMVGASISGLPKNDEPGSSVATRERLRTSPDAFARIPSREGATGTGRRAHGGSAHVRRAAIWGGAVLVLVAVGLVGLRVFLDAQWFVGVSGGHVAVFRGVPAEIVGFRLHHEVTETEIPAADAESLALYRDLRDGITADGREDAEAIVREIRRDLARAERTAST
jgi:serine/threonine protein phosphatase PrpC